MDTDNVHIDLTWRGETTIEMKEERKGDSMIDLMKLPKIENLN